MVDSLKHLSPDIDVVIHPNGSLAFSISETEFNTKLAFEGLTVTVQNPNLDTEDGTAKCTVSSKRLGQILTNNTFRRCPVLISIKDGAMFRMEFVIRDSLILHYVIPALYREQ